MSAIVPHAATLLAFDTSTETMAVALGTPRGDHVLVATGGAAASAGLLPAVRTLLQRAGAVLSDLDAVAFGRGPGAFTGLRTSCAAAQGLAFGLGCPVLPLDSLLVVAEAARCGCDGGEGFEVAVAVDARIGEVYAARYRRAQGRWAVLQAAALCHPDDVAAQWRAAPPPCAAGSALALHAALREAAGRGSAAETDRAAALLTLAREAWQHGEGVDAAEALPVYLRDKVALTTAERAARAAAAP